MYNAKSNTTKVSFFWDQNQDNSLSGFLQKKQASDWLTYLVYQSQLSQECSDRKKKSKQIW